MNILHVHERFDAPAGAAANAHGPASGRKESAWPVAEALPSRPDLLKICGSADLSGPKAVAFREGAKSALEPSHRTIEINLTGTAFLDCAGLGALVALHKIISARRGTVRLVNPSPMCRQLLDLTQLSRIFEIERR
jgi:anti-anti-sigma factor